MKEKFIMKEHYKQNALYIAYYQQRVGKKAMPRQIAQVLIKFISDTFPKLSFSNTLRKEQKVAPGYFRRATCT